MSLTGGFVEALAVALAVGAIVGVVLGWPRLSGAGTASLAGRVGAVLVTNLAVLLVAAVLLNDQFGFFADWTDLAGALGARAPVSAARGGTSPQGALGRGPLATARNRAVPAPPPGQGPGGRILTYSVTGTRSGVTGEVLVDLPPSYRTDPQRAYPVLETFSGYPGGPGQWLGGMGLPEALDRASAAGRVGQAIIVSPALEIPPGQDTECVNGGAGRAPVETWVTQDVPAWVSAHFRTLPDRRAWATIGLSAGGWCAAMATMLHPQQYGGSVVMGGYFHPEFAGPPPFPPGSPQSRRYDLVQLARTAPPPVAMWLETSHADRLSYASSAALLKAARAPLSLQAVVLTHAGHRLSVWRSLLPGALDWLGRSLPGFAPGGPPA